tara:strand:- start:8364 stop:8600 length:237 start_codon:yes stop_codon:yes gene_type:complete
MYKMYKCSNNIFTPVKKETMNRREIALLVKTEAGWLQVDVTTRVTDVEQMIIDNLEGYPADTPYKVQQRIILHEREQA